MTLLFHYKVAPSNPHVRRQLNLGADSVPIRCLFLGAPETRRKIGAYCDLRSGWVLTRKAVHSVTSAFLHHNCPHLSHQSSVYTPLLTIV